MCRLLWTERSATLGGEEGFVMARTPAPGTRERILSVAARLFYEHGVRAVGLNQVIAEAAMGKNLLYTHFPTKTDLVAAYLEAAVQQRHAAAQRALDTAGPDPVDRLLALVGEVAYAVQHSVFRGCALRNYLTEFPDDATAGTAGGPSPTRVAIDFLTTTRRDVDDLTAQLKAPHHEGRQLAEQLWLLIDGLYTQAAYRGRADAHLDRGADAAVHVAHRLLTTA